MRHSSLHYRQCNTQSKSAYIADSIMEMYRKITTNMAIKVSYFPAEHTITSIKIGPAASKIQQDEEVLSHVLLLRCTNKIRKSEHLRQIVAVTPTVMSADRVMAESGN